MSWRKRLLVIVAALTQHWRQECCVDCGASWWTQTKAIPVSLCLECEDRHYSEWQERQPHSTNQKGAA